MDARLVADGDTPPDPAGNPGVDMHDRTDAAMRITGRILRGVWVDERNIADARDLASMLAEEGLPEPGA